MTATGRRRGKRTELALAHRLGCERTGPTGKNDADLKGASAEVFAYEVKERKQMPLWLLLAMQQAEKNAKGRTPVLILHPLGGWHERDLVILRMEYWEGEHGEVKA